LNTLIPIEYYELVYYNFLLLIVFLVLVQSNASSIFDKDNLATKKNLGLFFLWFIILYMGARPISFQFGDMAVYALEFEDYANGLPLNTRKEFVFSMFMKTASSIMSAEMFFLLCAFIYVFPLYLASKNFFKDYWFYSLFILIISYSFWAYGSNGIRNGIGTSLFIYGLSKNKNLVKVAFFLLAISIHASLVLPAVAFVISLFYKNVKFYLYAWFIAIPLSLSFAGFWEIFFLNLGFIEESRLLGYFSGDQSALDNIVEVKVGFRWDFLIYSATGVFAGYYYIFKKKFDDAFYNRLFAIYLMCNALWILVIRANFSNRFAYLSWFLLGLIIIYPLLKVVLFKKQHLVVGMIMFLYFLFTYVVNFIFAK
jgi:hypothetical protein